MLWKRAIAGGSCVLLTCLVFSLGCGGAKNADPAADQRAKELEQDIVTQLNRGKDFHLKKAKAGQPLTAPPPTNDAKAFGGSEAEGTGQAGSSGEQGAAGVPPK